MKWTGVWLRLRSPAQGAEPLERPGPLMHVPAAGSGQNGQRLEQLKRQQAEKAV